MASLPALCTASVETKLTTVTQGIHATPADGGRPYGRAFNAWAVLVPLNFVCRSRWRPRHGLRVAVRARPQDPPAPWQLVEAPNGSIKSWYYWNQDTGETSWDPPSVPVNGTASGKSSHEASAGRWYAARAEDGAVYYYNEETMETAWALPKDALLVEEEQETEDEEEQTQEEDAPLDEEEQETEEDDQPEEDVEDKVEVSSPSTGSRAPSKADYSNLKMEELKKILSARGLKVGGRKADLLARLLESDGRVKDAETTRSPQAVKKRARPKKRIRQERSEAARFLEEELGVEQALRLPEDATIQTVKSNLGFLMEELMPSKDFWAEAALNDATLFAANVDELRETLLWLEEFLWNQDWSVGFGRQALAERIRHRPFLLLQGVQGLTESLAWLEDNGLDDDVVRSYVAGPTAVPYPCEPYPWIELLQLGTKSLKAAQKWLMTKKGWTKKQVAASSQQEPYVLLTAATAQGAPKSHPGYPLQEPRESWLQTHAAEATE